MTNKTRTLGSVLSTSVADIYVSPVTFRSDVHSILVSNNSLSTVRVYLTWYKATTGVSYDISGGLVLYPNSIIQITDAFFLEKNDKIRGYASVGSVVTTSISVSEYYVTS